MVHNGWRYTLVVHDVGLYWLGGVQGGVLSQKKKTYEIQIQIPLHYQSKVFVCVCNSMSDTSTGCALVVDVSCFLKYRF